MCKTLARIVPIVLVALGCAAAPRSGGSNAPESQAAADAKQKPAAKNVGILVFNDLFITELIAPFDVYKHTGDKMNVFTVAPTAGTVKSYEGLVFQPDFTIANAPKIDVLVVPSGNGSMTADLKNEALVAFVKRTAASAEYVTSHCWGAFTLAAAGCLDGRECTTFPGYTEALQKQFPKVQARTDRRFVVADRYVTSNGGIAAFEAALSVVERLFGTETADKVATGLVYAPQNRKFATDPRIATQ